MPDQPEYPTSTPALDGFLDGARLVPLRGHRLRAALHDIWTEGDQRPPDPFDPQTKPQRIMVMWRLVRTTAQVKGMCAEDETLDASTEFTPSPWTNAFKPLLPPTAGAALRRGRARRMLEYHATGDGLPLLPPRGDAEAMERWCNAAAIIARDLGIERSPQGLVGLAGLLDPSQCSRSDVTPTEVLAFEEMLLFEALDLILDRGERAAIKHYRATYCFSLKEANGLLRVVKTLAVERSASSIEEKRALQEMRLEDYIGRTKDTMDMDGEMKGIKELAKVQGLTRTEPENQGREFFEVVKRISAQQDLALLPAADVAALDSRRAEEVAPVTIDARVVEEPQLAPEDHDDAEALAEYDQENA